MTDVIQVDPVRPDPARIAQAATCLRRGGLVAFPTETVYGLGAHALDRVAVARLFEAKGRPANDPLIVHVATLAGVAPLVASMPPFAAAFADRFWPGPLTLIMPRAAQVPPEVSAGLDTVAVRIPAHPVAQALLRAASIPVAAPSANLFSRPSPTRASHVLDDLHGRIDIVIDAGPTVVGLESTVLDLTSHPPRVLRPGAIGIDDLREILPGVQGLPARTTSDDHSPMPSPGLLSKHYAPRAPLTLYRGAIPAVHEAIRQAAGAATAAGARVGLLATADDARALVDVGTTVGDLGPDGNPGAIASRLYAALRALDAAGVDVILGRDLGRDEGLWRAIGDRLGRAAASVIVVSP